MDAKSHPAVCTGHGNELISPHTRALYPSKSCPKQRSTSDPLLSLSSLFLPPIYLHISPFPPLPRVEFTQPRKSRSHLSSATVFARYSCTHQWVRDNTTKETDRRSRFCLSNGNDCFGVTALRIWELVSVTGSENRSSRSIFFLPEGLIASEFCSHSREKSP